MPTGPLLYLELLLFLVGTLLYGFLVRELWRRPDVLPGNGPLRALAATLLLWFAGTLLDLWIVFLVGPLEGASILGAALDVVRGLGWLLAPAFLLHTLARLDATGSRLPRLFVVAGYAGLLLFVEPIVSILATRSPYLAETTARFYPRLVAHLAVCLLPAAWLAGRLADAARAERLAPFLRALRRLLPVLVALVALGLWIDPWVAEPGAVSALLRLAILGALLLPGVLFAYHVQRHNLLRLSLSNRFLRAVVLVQVVVLLLMLAGPALGVEDPALARRFVAWGLVVALGWGFFARFGVEHWSERSAAWRVFSGRTVTASRLDELMTRLESIAGDDREILDRKILDATAEAIGEWLGSDARFLPRTLATEALWRAVETFLVETGEIDIVHRLRRLPRELSRELDRHDLHAVFVLRVGDGGDRIDGDLRGLLGLAASATGGGHDPAELDAVRLVLRQLAALLAVRELAARELAAERRAAEQERLGLLGLVSASLAHEIKNPLSSIKVLAQTLREELAAEDPESDGALDLAAIVEQIDRLDRTAREILGFARPRAGDRTDLSALVASAVYVLRAEARKRAVEIVAVPGDTVSLEDFPEGEAEVAGSPGAWQTIVFNLLRNAVDHTPPEATMRVRLQAADDCVRLEVSNPGRLDPAVRDRLFEPFARGTGTSSGTGLGLALVARRAAEVGAEVTVEAQGEPEGEVTFRVVAPLDVGA